MDREGVWVISFSCEDLMYCLFFLNIVFILWIEKNLYIMISAMLNGFGKFTTHNTVVLPVSEKEAWFRESFLFTAKIEPSKMLTSMITSDWNKFMIIKLFWLFVCLIIFFLLLNFLLIFNLQGYLLLFFVWKFSFLSCFIWLLPPFQF